MYAPRNPVGVFKKLSTREGTFHFSQKIIGDSKNSVWQNIRNNATYRIKEVSVLAERYFTAKIEVLGKRKYPMLKDTDNLIYLGTLL